MSIEIKDFINLANNKKKHERYNNSKIYKLVNSVDNKIFIGATCTTLTKCLYTHKSHAKKEKNNVGINKLVNEYFNKIGWDKVKIILISNVVVSNKEELKALTFNYIQDLKPSLNA